MRNRTRSVRVSPVRGVLRHTVGTETAETETTGQCGVRRPLASVEQCGVSPLQLVNIQAAREICRQCAGEMSSTFTNSFKHLMNVLKLREKMSCLGLGWLLGIQSCMNEELQARLFYHKLLEVNHPSGEIHGLL